MYSLLLLSLVSLAVALALTPLFRDLAIRFRFVDVPGERKVHSAPVPRVGGIAIAIAYLTAYACLWAFRLDAGQILRDHQQLIVRLALAGLVMFAVGLADDLFGLKPWYKLAGQFIAATLAVWSGVRITGVVGLELPLWCALPLSVLWLIACANAFNLIDGLDGLAAGVGFLATVTVLIAAFAGHNIPLVLATVPLTGALLGFLRYNYNPASIFLGDCGSLLIGFMLGCFGILWSQKSATVLGITAPLIAMSIPLVDTGLAITRRFLRLQPIFRADQGHIHHRLLSLGFTPRRVIWLMYGLCAMSACLSLLQSVLREQLAGAIIVLFCICVCVGIQRLGYSEFGVFGKMLMGGSFRRLVNARLQLDDFQAGLKAASTTDECWDVIQRAYSEFGFTEVVLRLGERLYSDATNGRPVPRTWTMNVPLAGSDSIELSSEFDVPSTPMAAGFADVLGEVLSRKHWVQARRKALDDMDTCYFEVNNRQELRNGSSQSS